MKETFGCQFSKRVGHHVAVAKTQPVGWCVAENPNTCNDANSNSSVEIHINTVHIVRWNPHPCTCQACAPFPPCHVSRLNGQGHRSCQPGSLAFTKCLPFRRPPHAQSPSSVHGISQRLEGSVQRNGLRGTMATQTSSAMLALFTSKKLIPPSNMVCSERRSREQGKWTIPHDWTS